MPAPLLLLVSLWLSPSLPAAPAISVTLTQRVHPVLIRNDHNELLELAITVTGTEPINLRSVACGVTGTAPRKDIATLELLALPDRKPFGSPAAPASKVIFKGDALLKPGANVFWLSAKLQPAASLDHRLSATCSAVKTSAGAIAINSGAPSPLRRIGIALRKHNDDGVHTYRIPALATSAQGTLLAVYDMRRRMPRDLQEDIDIGLSRSTDGGRTWETPRVIMDMGTYGGLPQELNGCSDPGIIVDRTTGEILVFAVWMNGKGGKHQWNDDGSEPGYEIGKTAQLLLVRSRDEGRTWSKPENLTRTLKKEAWWLLAPAPQQGIQLADGTLVMPMQGRDEKGIPFATIMSSRDHGATWTLGAPAHFHGSECQVTQLSDGSLMLNIRTDSHTYRAVYVTNDFGRTWRAHETNGNTLIEPSCNGSLYRLDHKGRAVLLFANPHSQKARTHHTLQVSLDDGRTWPEKLHLLLDEGRGRGYPSITRIDADHIGIVYEGSRADLTFEKINLRELLNR